MPIHLDDLHATLMLSLLVEIRDVLREIATPPPDLDGGEPPCEHEHRIDFGSLGETWWRCQDCGCEYRTNGTALTGAKES